MELLTSLVNNKTNQYMCCETENCDHSYGESDEMKMRLPSLIFMSNSRERMVCMNKSLVGERYMSRIIVRCMNKSNVRVLSMNMSRLREVLMNESRLRELCMNGSRVREGYMNKSRLREIFKYMSKVRGTIKERNLPGLRQ